MFVYYTNNDNIFRFPTAKLSLYFNNTIDTLIYLTTSLEVGLSHGVRKVRRAAQSSDKKTGESYIPPSSLSHRITVLFYA